MKVRPLKKRWRKEEAKNGMSERLKKRLKSILIIIVVLRFVIFIVQAILGNMYIYGKLPVSVVYSRKPMFSDIDTFESLDQYAIEEFSDVFVEGFLYQQSYNRTLGFGHTLIDIAAYIADSDDDAKKYWTAVTGEPASALPAKYAWDGDTLLINIRGSGYLQYVAYEDNKILRIGIHGSDTRLLVTLLDTRPLIALLDTHKDVFDIELPSYSEMASGMIYSDPTPEIEVDTPVLYPAFRPKETTNSPD